MKARYYSDDTLLRNTKERLTEPLVKRNECSPGAQSNGNLPEKINELDCLFKIIYFYSCPWDFRIYFFISSADNCPSFSFFYLIS